VVKMNELKYFTYEDYEKIKKEVLRWLPPKIVDGHVHTATKVQPHNYHLLHKSILNGDIIRKGLYAHNFIFKHLFPDKKFFKVGFPLPLRKVGVQPSYVNHLLINEMKKGGLAGCMLESQNISILNKAIEDAKKHKVKYHGIKFHPWMFDKKKDKLSIKDYFNKTLLRFCEENKLTIICELPNGWKIKDIKVLRKILTNHNLKIVIPHLGFNNRGFILKFSEYIKDLTAPYGFFKRQISKVKDIENLYFDTAMIVDERLMRAAFEVLGDDRILWGDDYPYCFTQKIEELRRSDEELAKDLFNILHNKPDKVKDVWIYHYDVYQQIQIIKNIANQMSFKKSKNFSRKVFCNNAIKAYNMGRFTSPLKIG